VSATTPIRLVQDDDAPVGILICMPIFDAEPDRGDPTTARRTLGFVVGILRIDDVVKEALAACHTEGLCIRIVDTQAPPGQDVLYQTCKSEMGKPHGQSGEPGRTCYGHFLADLHFRIAGRDWALSVGLDPPGLAPVVSPAPLLLLLAGLLVTALLAAYLLRLLQFNHRLGVEVRERERAERELLRSQEELEHRVARRTRELTNKADALQRMSVELSLTEERERRKLAIALHDQIGQTLSLIQMKLLDLRNETSLETLSREIGQCLDLTQETKQRVHSMEADLCPSILYDYGFEEAARWLADRTMQEHGFDVNFTDDGLDKPMSEATQLVLYRSLRELLFNVVKYAKATMVDVSISQRDGNAVLSVRDDGVGFSAGPEGTPGSQGGCFGLASIRQQVGRVNGRVEINSAVGRGTSVEITVPLELGGKDLSPEGLGQPQEPAHG
jgi:signal transduction histidine kinase